MKKKLSLLIVLISVLFVPTFANAKTTIDVPTDEMCSNVIYNGEEQMITVEAPVGFTWQNNMKTDAGDYEVTAVLNEDYEWNDTEAESDKTITCSIARAKISKPALVKYTYNWTGSAITPTFTGFDENTMAMLGNTSETAKGQYSINISPLENYEWQDGGIESETYIWSIIKGIPTIPTVNSYNGIYDGEEHTIEATCDEGFTLEYSLDQVEWSDTKPASTELGVTEVYVRTKENENYFSSEIISSEIRIYKLVDVPTSSDCANLTYNGQEQQIVFNNSEGYHWADHDLFANVARDYGITAILNENYKWSDGNSGTERYITCTVKKAKVQKPRLKQDNYTFAGHTIYPDYIGYDETKTNRWGYLGATSVGDYSTELRLVSNNYEWSDGTSDPIVFTWHIVKKTPTDNPEVRPYYGKYDGEAHTIDAAYLIDGFTLEYSIDGTNWSEVKPTRTEVGTTIVYVRTAENENNNPSDTIESIITITSSDVQTGWLDDGQNVYYIGEDGRPLTGVQYLDKRNGSNGEKAYYCFFPDGTMVIDSLLDTEFGRYYFGIDGAAVTGWFDFSNYRYHAGDDGKLTIGYFTDTDDRMYYFSEDESYLGQLQTGEIVIKDSVIMSREDEGSSHTIEYVYNTHIAAPEDDFVDPVSGETKKKGEIYTSGLQVSTITWFDSSSSIIPSDVPITGWYDDGEHKYYIDNNGIPKTGLFTDTDGRIYYLNPENNSGDMLTGLQMINDQLYYFALADDNANNIKKGQLLTGWQTVDGNKYYFRTADDVPTTGFEGTAVIGFVDIDSESYYFRIANQNPSGGPYASMFKGFAIINGEKHYFRTTEDEISAGSEGSMLKSACVTVDNGYYCFDENGDLESQVILISKPTDSRCNLGLVYDGSNKTLISDPTSDEGFTWSNYTEVNAGEHTVIATLNEGYKWNDDSTEPASIVCSIAKQQLTVPTMAVSNFDYSGYLITPIIANFNSYVMNIDGNESAIEAGEYTSTVSLKFPSNYEWADGTNNPILFSWKIEKIGYAAPTVSPYLGLYDGEEHSVTATGEGTLEYSTDNILWSTDEIKYSDAGEYPVYVRVKADNNHNASQSVESSITINKIVVNYPTLVTSLFNYTGENITPELTGVNDYMTVSGETTGKNAGNYSIMVSLNDRTNTIWDNNTDSAYTLNWRIAKVTGGVPTVEPYVGTYDKQSHSIEAIGSGELEYSEDNTNWVDENPAKSNAGVYTIYVRTKGDENHDPSNSISSTITINKKSLFKPTKTTSSYLFTGNQIDFSVNFFNDNWSEWMMKSGTYTATTVGEYVAEVALLDSINTEWADGTTANVSFTWYISQSQATNPIITNYTGAFDGQPHSITVETPSYGTVFYSTNYNIPGEDTVWSTTNPTRINVGNTNVYVYIKGDSNHTDSQVVMGSITITDAVPDYSIDNYTVDENNKFITGIPVGTELDAFVNSITLGTGYSVVVDTKTIDGKQVLYTGGKTTIKQGNAVVAVFTNVVSGDSSGDGKVNYLDYVYVYNHIQKTKHPESSKQLLIGAYLKAGDMSNDDNITYLDYVFIYNKIKELKGGNN
ncbi:MAG: hypothetical protein IKP98_03770 [Bacilli bacterium]|nr:hypothetical protein [Bacilli bacterium]